MSDAPGRVFRHVLVMGGEREHLASVALRLQQVGHTCRAADGAAEGLRIHRDEGADVIVLLLPCADLAGAEAIIRLKAQDPRAVILVTGRDDSIEGAPDALELGATDYLPAQHPDPNALLTLVDVSLGTRKSDAQLRYLRKKDAAGAQWHAIIGQCPAMRRVFGTVRQICHRTASGGSPTILITGETGTGKGLMAKAVHYNSVRRSRAFVAVNCPAIPPTLIEAELFGHTRGAFTGARASRAGLFETADDGSLLLDEIGALSLDLQAKLLTVIEDKTIRRLGASTTTTVDVQIVAATHRDLAAMVRHGDFRADLFHRLNVIAVHLPPLRDRGEDRLLLAEATIREICAEYGVPPKHLTADGRRAIEAYDWPGNVRELRNRIERVVLLQDSDTVGAAHLRLGSAGSDLHVVGVASDAKIEIALPESQFSLEQLNESVERAVIAKVLGEHGGNVSRAARHMGITRQALIYRLRKHGLRSEV